MRKETVWSRITLNTDLPEEKQIYKQNKNKNTFILTDLVTVDQYWLSDNPRSGSQLDLN